MTAAEVVIREVTGADLATVAAFRRTWDPPTHLALDVEGDAGFDARFADWWRTESDHRTTWVAWDAGVPVALTGLLEYRAMPTPGLAPRRWGYLGNMYVDAAYRDRGLGSRLLHTVLEAADARGYRRVVLAPSVRSVPFYVRAGFVDAGPDAHGNRLLVRPAPR